MKWRYSVESSIGAESGVGIPDLSAVVSSLNFHSIWWLLIISPGLLTVSLGLGKSFVFVLHGLHHIILLHGGFIFEHSSHTGNSISLHGVSLFFRAIPVSLIAVFTVLLVAPFLLSLGVNLHAGLVYYKLISYKVFTYISPLPRTVWLLKHELACPGRVCQSVV